MRKLDVLIATHGSNGLRMVEQMRLPEVDGVCYVVVWQKGCENDLQNSPLSSRGDVEVHISDTLGSSRNHNIGISLAKAPLCLIADNDLRYTPRQLQSVIEVFETHPDVELATFKHIGARKKYPPAECDLAPKPPKGYNVVNFEMAFRKDSLRGVRYNERFGINAKYQLAEDDIFFYDCLEAGLKSRFFPIEITTHANVSTGFRPYSSAEAIVGSGASLRHIYGFFKGLPRVPLFVFRNWRKARLSFWRGLVLISKGFLCYRK